MLNRIYFNELGGNWSQGIKERNILALSECQHPVPMGGSALRPSTPHGPWTVPVTEGVTAHKGEQVRHKPSLRKPPKPSWGEQTLNY